MPRGKNMFERLWERMDELLDTFNALKAFPPPGPVAWPERPEVCELRGEMRGVGHAIREFSHPFFQEENAVAKHAMLRWRAKCAGEQLPNTPGVDGFSPLPPAGVALREVSAFRPKKPAHNLKTDDVKAIQNAKQSGMFSDDDLASIYKVSVEVVKSL